VPVDVGEKRRPDQHAATTRGTAFAGTRRRSRAPSRRLSNALLRQVFLVTVIVLAAKTLAYDFQR
jgi:hypothetical protein